MTKIVTVSDIPKAGPYSHAVVAGNFIYLSGQAGTIPKKTTNLEEQFENAMSKVKKILEAGGFNLENVVKTSIYLSKKEDFQKMNDLYSRYFAATPPARTTLVTGFVNNDMLVEIDVIASK